MKLQNLAKLFTTVAFVMCGTVALGQAPAAPNPIPKAGILFEPVQGNAGPESKFTNRTADDLGIVYGKDKFILKPGDAKTIPTPQQQIIDFKIFEKRADDGQMVQRFESKTAPNAKKQFIPFPWARPNK